MGTEKEIRAELRAFEAQFGVCKSDIPAGTPNRNRLYREACEDAGRRRLLPENVSRLRELLDKLRAAMRVEARQRMIANRPADHAERQRVFRELRRLGFAREHVSGRSAYYRRGSLVVRVSDHDVPVTPEREWNSDNGGRTWSGSWRSLVVGRDDANEWLAGIREYSEVLN